MQLPEHARKARRSSRRCKMKLPSVADLLIDLGLAGENPAPDRALIREFDDTLKAFTDRFLSRKKLQRIALTQWSVQSNQDLFRQLATSFLHEDERGFYFWPNPPRPSNKKGYRFSTDRKKICDLLMLLAFRRNQNLMNNQRNRINPAYPVTLLPTTTATNAAQQQTAQQQPDSSETTDTQALRPSQILQDRGLSFDTPIDVDEPLDFDLNTFNYHHLSDDEAPRNPKYLRDPGFPSPELPFPPLVPRPATVEDEIDEYYLELPNRVPRERTHTVAPEETEAVPAQDPYDGPDSPEIAAPSINQGEKRPAEAELEDPARRTKSPRLEQDNAAVTTACSGDGDDDDNHQPHSPVDQVTDNSTSDGETRQAQLYDYVLPDGLSRIDGLPGSTSHQGSPELGEDSYMEALARRSAALGPLAKAPLALMSDEPAPEPDTEVEASRKQPEMDTLEDKPPDEPLKAQACLREGAPQDDVLTTQPETDDDIQNKSRSQPLHSEEPEQPAPVVKGKQQPETPQVEDTPTHEPARDATSKSDLTFAFTVYQTEMRPVVWNYSERDFFNGSLRDLVDALPMEDKGSLKGLCISLMGKRPDQYQVFLYNEVKYRNVRDIYLTTIKQEMQEAKLDGSRLDYEVIIRAIRSR
ncbi:hypothetical protein N0V84_008889 [Fusarium piperis]|uniref:Uncharacterized protein n=1 Tax=Fusarium piperis TaxID=1435070 RepID=A0A9W8W794_9HYPO|nr:hypothetical protein N0V84_008889 [Fusarium piperis]